MFVHTRMNEHLDHDVMADSEISARIGRVKECQRIRKWNRSISKTMILVDADRYERSILIRKRRVFVRKASVIPESLAKLYVGI